MAGFEFSPHKAIGKSPFEENAFSQCVDNDTIPGTARVNNKTVQKNSASIGLGGADTFVRNGTLFIDTTAQRDWVTGTAVQMTTTGTLPGGLSLATTYYLRNADSDTYGVFPTFTDAQNDTNRITLTDDGSGTHTVTPVEMDEAVKFLNNRMIDANGNFWEWNAAASMWKLLSKGSGSGEGFEEWQSYAFLFRGGNIDTYRLSDGTLTVAWQSDSGGPSLVGQDDIVYIGSGNDIRSIARGTGSFNPASGSTYTYSSSALDLPDGETVTCLTELGLYLGIGTIKNKLFLWDRASSSFELPVSLPDVPRILVTVNNIMYCVLNNGDIVAANGTSYQTLLRFPRHIFDTDQENPSFVFGENGWRVEEDRIFIGYGSSATTNPLGVFSFNITTGEFKLEHVSSTGNTGGTSETRIRVPALQNRNIFFIAFTEGGATYNIDRVDLEEKYANSETIIYSPFAYCWKCFAKTSI